MALMNGVMNLSSVKSSIINHRQTNFSSAVPRLTSLRIYAVQTDPKTPAASSAATTNSTLTKTVNVGKGKWALESWKTKAKEASAEMSHDLLDRDMILTLDKISSIGLFAIGLMASAVASGVAVQSILIVGGVGGVATAFAAKDILANVFSRPFSIGDTIKAGSVEGQVVEMGLTTTSLLNDEGFPVVVPNSLFSNQVIVNKSRAQWRGIASTIPLQIEDLDTIPQISNEIKENLRSNPKVFLGKEAPYCYLSRVEKSFAELTIGCNLKYTGKDELYTTQQEVLLESVKIIIKKHGASLGTT